MHKNEHHTQFNLNNSGLHAGIDPVIIQNLTQHPDLIEKALAEKKLINFIKIMWSDIDKNTFVDGWHLHAICDHLEAVQTGDIKRLLINIPPRHMKSITCAVAYPCWCWVKDPTLQFLYATYAQNLTMRDSVKCRDLIMADKYQKYWGDTFRLKEDQNTKTKFINDKKGIRFATSIGGTVTGEGGDIILVDDPNNTQEKDSEAARYNTIQWFDSVLTSRLNNPDSGSIVVIQQRVHEDDLSGHIMKKYTNYDTLILPAEYEKGRVFVSSIGWKDKRQEEGELLWGERISKNTLEDFKIGLGVYDYAGQYQQRPAPKEGGIIPLNLANRYEVAPDIDEVGTISLSIDTAYSEKETNDPTCIQVWFEMPNKDMYLIENIVKHMAYPELKKTVKQMIRNWSPHETLIEDKASGITLIQDLRATPRYRHGVIAMSPKNESKLVRMENETTAFESGMVFLPHKKVWLTKFEEECSTFPNGSTKDQVDAMSQYLKRRRMKRNRRGLDNFKMQSVTKKSSWSGV